MIARKEKKKRNDYNDYNARNTISRVQMNTLNNPCNLLTYSVQGGPKNGATLHFPKYLENY